ncbi:uncharacterized protein LOC128990658 [Macrosteles quadrilineatus]|uniref:uncharacterized protein LOC128990658 n=1 Tax=Macrosteles quadrilineatus TaxID=74068 RepID=UPI0023E18DFF|nr:uncharacterized protein LOC128990658 [Macrosteles quadrilineatus]
MSLPTLLSFARVATRAAHRFMVPVVTARNKTYKAEEVLSNNEMSVYKRLFNKMDSNKDGNLTKEDLKQGLKDFVNYSASEEELEETMKTLDSDKNGTIDFEEFIGYIAWSRQMRVEESIKYAFGTFDRNKDGLINKDELREALVSLGVMPNEVLLNNIMLVSDVDSDGNITMSQFKDIFYYKNPLQ